jgi:hypothetical protein
MSTFQSTQYPQIYINTYWGSSFLEPYNGITLDIITNRNNFIREYNINKCIVDPPKYITNQIQNEVNLGICDHLEYYKTNDKRYILISSPYKLIGETKNRIENEYNQNGWVQFVDLYSTNTFTYIKILDSR